MDQLMGHDKDAHPPAFPPPPPPVPPPLPPPPFELTFNSEISLYPVTDKNSTHTVLTTLLAVSRPAVVVGVLGDHAEATTQFSNRILEKNAFSNPSSNQQGLNLRIFFEPEKRMIILLGLCAPLGLVDDDIEQAMSTFTHLKAKLHLLLYTSCHLLYIVKGHSRMSTSHTKWLRTLAQCKLQLLHHLKQGKTSSKLSPYAPGWAVPLVSYVFPLPPTFVSRQHKSRSFIMAYCKSMESRVQSTLKPLRNNIASTIRLKDVPGSVLKERRLFLLDPSHTVIAVSRKVATAEGNVLDRMAAVMIGDLDDTETSLKLLDDDEHIGMPHVAQFVVKCVDIMLEGNEDAKEKDLALSVSQWIRQFQEIVKIVMEDPDGLFFDNSRSIGLGAKILSDAEMRNNTTLSLYETLNPLGTLAHAVCTREAASAVKRYQVEKPEKCSTRVHEMRVEKTLLEFNRSVGAAAWKAKAKKFVSAIEEACAMTWNQGRRLCDAMSISNRPCGLLLHKENPFRHNSGFYLTLACTCGQTSHRLPDAFSIESNHEDLWLLPCCHKCERLSTHVRRLGDFAAYNPFEGLNSTTGFVRKYATLSPWISPIHMKKKHDSKQKKKTKAVKSSSSEGNSNKTSSELLLYAGLEYECSMGHRFFCHMTDNPPLEACSTLKANNTTDLTVPVDFAQLRRIYAALPTASSRSVSLHVNIKIEGQDHVVFSLIEDKLPVDSIVCCSLPYVFESPDGLSFHHGASLKLQSKVFALSSNSTTGSHSPGTSSTKNRGSDLHKKSSML